MPSEFVEEDNSEQARTIVRLIEFVPLKVERSSYMNEYMYLGSSPLFAEIDKNDICPRYYLQNMIDDDGNVIKVIV